MKSHADRSVTIQTSAESALSPPSWLGEVVVIAEYLRKHSILTKIREEIQFARRRFGCSEVIDFLAIRIALCHQRGTHAGGILPATPTVCRPMYGLV